ncbi:protein kinase domain-containing protein [Arthrobacter sp. UM1]|uniref:protein kinase domain-containing protein n=1 Tax=Arthrobacter sp. UM1 TaxID=2766776 RepID=UPI001CF67C7A|nr:phosphotransferase [Arthrobacter sp. UM1]
MTADSAPRLPPPLAVLRPLGRGRGGTVWLVRSEDDGALLAYKPSASREEASLTRSAAGPGVVEVVPRSDVAGLFTRAAEGGTLEALSAGRGLSPECVLHVARGLAAAVARLAGEGLVHGDIHPGNVLLTSDGEVVLADFGKARRTSRKADLAEDVRAMAAAVWFCATGASPPPAKERPPVSLLTGMPPELGRLVETALGAEEASAAADRGGLKPPVRFRGRRREQARALRVRTWLRVLRRLGPGRAPTLRERTLPEGGGIVRTEDPATGEPASAGGAVGGAWSRRRVAAAVLLASCSGLAGNPVRLVSAAAGAEHAQADTIRNAAAEGLPSAGRSAPAKEQGEGPRRTSTHPAPDDSGSPVSPAASGGESGHVLAASAREAAVRLVKARSEALAAGDAQGLLAVSAAGSPARRQDERLAASLRPGEAFEGLSSKVTAMGEARGSEEGAGNDAGDGRAADDAIRTESWELVVRTENTAYRFRGALRPARTEEARVTVTRTSSEWLLVGYAPQGAPGEAQVPAERPRAAGWDLEHGRSRPGAAARGPVVSPRARSSPASPGV